MNCDSVGILDVDQNYNFCSGRQKNSVSNINGHLPSLSNSFSAFVLGKEGKMANK